MLNYWGAGVLPHARFLNDSTRLITFHFLKPSPPISSISVLKLHPVVPHSSATTERPISLQTCSPHDLKLMKGRAALSRKFQSRLKSRHPWLSWGWERWGPSARLSGNPVQVLSDHFPSLTTWASVLPDSCAGTWVRQHRTNSLLHTNSRTLVPLALSGYPSSLTLLPLFLTPVVIPCSLSPQKSRNYSTKSWAFPWQPGLSV